MQNEVLDRSQAWTGHYARERLDEAVPPLDRLLHDLGGGDALAAVDERTRRRLEVVLEAVRGRQELMSSQDLRCQATRTSDSGRASQVGPDDPCSALPIALGSATVDDEYSRTFGDMGCVSRVHVGHRRTIARRARELGCADLDVGRFKRPHRWLGDPGCAIA
jgi:hypothetical protein